LRRPGLHYPALATLGIVEPLPREIYEGIEIALKYAGYIERQTLQIARVSQHQDQALPSDLHYGEMACLSKEAREKLLAVRPLTVGQASRIAGVSPADINALLVYLQTRRLVAT